MLLAVAAASCGEAHRGPDRPPRMSGAALRNPAPITLPKLHEETLPNGLTVMILEDHEVPAVSLSLLWPVGSASDPADKAGLGLLTASLLRQGTAKRTAAQIADEIDFVGGDLAADTGTETTSLGVTVLRTHLDVGLELLRDVTLHPTFPADEIEDLKRQLIAGTKQEFDDPSSLAAAHARTRLYGESNPYAFRMSERSLTAITRADILKHWEKHYRPDRAVLAVSGDVVPAQISTRLRALFAVWQPGAAPPPQFPAMPEPRRQVVLVDKPDQTQSHIRVMLPAIPRKHPDYHRAMLMNYVLGGGTFSSRLIRVVRVEGGKTYGIGSSFATYRKQGSIGIATSTRNAETVATIDLILQELTRMRDLGVTEVELRAAKSNLVGSYPLDLETPDDVLGEVIYARFHELPIREVTHYRGILADVPIAEVNDAAKKYLRVDDAVIVVVGRAEEIRAPLQARFGAVEEVGWLDPTHSVDRAKKPAERSAHGGKKR